MDSLLGMNQNQLNFNDDDVQDHIMEVDSTSAQSIKHKQDTHPSNPLNKKSKPKKDTTNHGCIIIAQKRWEQMSEAHQKRSNHHQHAQFSKLAKSCKEHRYTCQCDKQHTPLDQATVNPPQKEVPRSTPEPSITSSHTSPCVQ